ncbi:MAG: hypothetical protein IJX30_04680 [Clostridia bacterium]|nr:hypothetical protein [Clostridia bacterium]
MKIHNKYGYGQLFCFSGMDGETSRDDDFVAMMLDEPITLRFHFDKTVTLKIPVGENAVFNAVTGDILDGNDFFVGFIDKYTIVGKSPVKPFVLTEGDHRSAQEGNTEKIRTNFAYFYLTTEYREDAYYFTFSYRTKNTEVLSQSALDAIKKTRLAYFEGLPACKDEKYERLYYKCLSVNKENVYSAEGEIPCRWTTPDRIPHRFLWLWDSAFHSMALAEYDLGMAKDAIRAVLAVQEENGFIAHMSGVYGSFSNITQPPVLAWAVWNIYRKDGDKAFLKECAPALAKFLIWMMKNRDENQNGLLEWLTEPEYANCKCGESGLDNHPRFDFENAMDAVDFSTYLCNDAKYLACIFEAIADKDNAEYFRSVYDGVKEKINSLLWCEEDGLYYDRLFDGKLTGVASPFSFLPMFAGICNQEQADKMVKVLLDEKRFWTAMPIPSMPKNSPYYDIDMWRGCSWLNINYFIILGLRKYGYTEVANELREKTLEGVNKWYEETGNVFEFYDADNQISPFHLKRKGEPPQKPDYREHIHAISDYNWSACFIELLINEIYN